MFAEVHSEEESSGVAACWDEEEHHELWLVVWVEEGDDEEAAEEGDVQFDEDGGGEMLGDAVGGEWCFGGVFDGEGCGDEGDEGGDGEAEEES